MPTWPSPGDYGYTDVLVSSNVSTSGIFTNIRDFKIASGVTVTVTAYDGSALGGNGLAVNGTGLLQIQAAIIQIDGTINANDSGFEGGMGGSGGAGGAGHAGSNGNNGGGPFSGAGGTGGARNNHVGTVGGNGGYNVAGGNTDSDTDDSLKYGSGGGGAGGGGGGVAAPDGDDALGGYGGGGAGGGGAGYSGGGAVRLMAEKIILNGTIESNPTEAGMGSNAFHATAGAGGVWGTSTSNLGGSGAGPSAGGADGIFTSGAHGGNGGDASGGGVVLEFSVQKAGIVAGNRVQLGASSAVTNINNTLLAPIGGTVKIITPSQTLSGTISSGRTFQKATQFGVVIS